MKNILRIFSSALLVIIILGGIVYAAPGIKMINIAGFNFFTFFQDNSANTGIDASYVHTRVNDSYFPSPADNFNYIRGKTFLGNDTVVVDGSGNVGIGTTTPTAALTVSGNIIANTPTAGNHVATKAYVDAQVSAAGGGGGGGCTIVGGPCGGGILAGTFRGYFLIVTPPGCTDSPTPTCNHYGTDTLTKTWNNGTSNWTTTSTNSTADGASNTAILAASVDAGSPHYAAKYCADMVYAGYSDWYLPAMDELNILFLNRVSIYGFGSIPYWSSTEYNINYAWYQIFTNGTQSSNSKNLANSVRCIRKI